MAQRLVIARHVENQIKLDRSRIRRRTRSADIRESRPANGVNTWSEDPSVADSECVHFERRRQHGTPIATIYML